MNKKILSIGFLLAALAVILGAFGAHTLKTKVGLAELNIFDTGVKYQMYHSFAIIICGILYAQFPYKKVQWASNLFLIGIVLFSFSLYFLTYLKTGQIQSLYWIGAITPIGGLFFVAGWLLLVFTMVSKK